MSLKGHDDSLVCSMTLERSRVALRHAQRARNELPAAIQRPDDFLYHFRCSVALLIAVGPTVEDEVGAAGPKGWWKPLLTPHASQLMKLRDPILKQNKPPASVKHTIQARLVHDRDDPEGTARVIDTKILSSTWTWDSGPYQDQGVLDVIDLYLDLLRS